MRAGYSDLDLNHADPVMVALAADYDTGAELTLDGAIPGLRARWVGTWRSGCCPTTSRPVSDGVWLCRPIDSVVRDARMTLAALTDSLVGAVNLP
ncbi:hypothetical protein GCM10010339_43980 [Streptomyces alanosinicus]|uniref:Uncharacterized protein n=1 Tax=Streptomyces alanosinicus TaxID=68171 RepID=A0A918YK74_9ACTN|nr:hypothetical protein GCM10010339_43980 [Streptomyces alanosinicus]